MQTKMHGFRIIKAIIENKQDMSKKVRHHEQIQRVNDRTDHTQSDSCMHREKRSRDVVIKKIN